MANKYLFIDRELQPETGYFDLKWRQYDPAKARFDAVDSKPDEGDQESLSTYQYGWNNPILRTDPNGLNPGDKKKEGDSFKNQLQNLVNYIWEKVPNGSKFEFNMTIGPQVGLNFGKKGLLNLKLILLQHHLSYIVIPTKRKMVNLKEDFNGENICTILIIYVRY